MFELIAITDRHLPFGSFLERLNAIAATRPAAIVLREKDLSESAYQALATLLLDACEAHDTPCVLHNFPAVAKNLKIKRLHLPLPRLRELSEEDKERFESIGASCHSEAEVKEAERLGATRVIVGHIFDTPSKAGTPGRGIDFLERMVRATDLPVYAIGGINADNIRQVKDAGAKGACIMSGYMEAADVAAFAARLEEQVTDV